ncbi:MAG: energy-coupling factor transporter ATPase [Ruminococcaceae bacterium]|nr:energy-coupling factor transporter ATPase [Oscillospiraceae bacterium]
MNPFIKTVGLSYKYEDADVNDSPVLSDLSLEINEGEFVAVLGHNGSGKSTFAKLLNLILAPSSGEIYLEGKLVDANNISEQELLELRKSVGMVFQNPDNQLVATIVEDDVAFGPENLGIPSKEIRERVDAALRDVGMLEYAKHEPHRLSGGQKQRVAIAGIIAMMPKCIIFDESTAMLDPVGRKEVMNSIVRLNREKGITVIMITHYMEEAALADRIIVLDDGRMLLDGTPSYVFEHEDMLKECGLNVPQGTELIHKLITEGHLERQIGECVTLEQCADIIANALKKDN